MRFIRGTCFVWVRETKNASVWVPPSEKGVAQLALKYTALTSTSFVRFGFKLPAGSSPWMRSSVCPATQALMAWRVASTPAPKSTGSSGAPNAARVFSR